jgi:hypothetical protein
VRLPDDLIQQRICRSASRRAAHVIDKVYTMVTGLLLEESS